MPGSNLDDSRRKSNQLIAEWFMTDAVGHRDFVTGKREVPPRETDKTNKRQTSSIPET